MSPPAPGTGATTGSDVERAPVDFREMVGIEGSRTSHLDPCPVRADLKEQPVDEAAREAFLHNVGARRLRLYRCVLQASMRSASSLAFSFAGRAGLRLDDVLQVMSPPAFWPQSTGPLALPRVRWEVPTRHAWRGGGDDRMMWRVARAGGHAMRLGGDGHWVGWRVSGDTVEVAGRLGSAKLVTNRGTLRLWIPHPLPATLCLALAGRPLAALVHHPHAKMTQGEARAAVRKAWSIFENGLGDDAVKFTAALVEAVEQHSDEITAGEASDIFGVLGELGLASEVDRLIPIYLTAQDGKPRAFFERTHAGGRAIDPRIDSAFKERLADMPLVRDPGEVLLRIGNTRSWAPTDTAFLASVSAEEYREMLRQLNAGEHQSAIPTALDFGRMVGGDPNYRVIGERMQEALRHIAAESSLNRLRMAPYLREQPEDAGGAGYNGEPPAAS